MERQPWECPRCLRMIAPHVDVHDCDEGDGGAAVPARHPAPPSGPPVSATNTAWTGNPGTCTITVGGTVMNGRELVQAIRAENFRHAQRNGPGAVFDMAAARARRRGAEAPSAG